MSRRDVVVSRAELLSVLEAARVLIENAPQADDLTAAALCYQGAIARTLFVVAHRLLELDLGRPAD